MGILAADAAIWPALLILGVGALVVGIVVIVIAVAAVRAIIRRHQRPMGELPPRDVPPSQAPTPTYQQPQQPQPPLPPQDASGKYDRIDRT